MVSKILHVIPSVSSVHGGPSVMLELLARDLSSRGIEVHVATTDDDGPGRLNIPLGVPITRGGVFYWFFRRQTRFYKFSQPLSAWLAAHVAEYQVVHIHALFSHASVAAARWAHRRNVPYVIRPLGTLNCWGMENRRPWLKQLSFRMIERRILRNAAFVHYTSEQERQEAALLGVTARAEIIPNPVQSSPDEIPPGQFRAKHPELRNREIILFLSRFDRKKGLDILLPAFARVRERFPSAALVLAGSGNPALVEALHAEARSLGIAGDIVWPGFLEGAEKQAAFADSDVFVLPSYSENFGIAVVEAMAAGCPAVVSDQVAIHSDIAAAHAGLVVRCDAGELADALCHMLSDRAVRSGMGFNGKCLTQTHYSLETVTSRLMCAYNSIGN
jgi:glycosyltransferase involved in cell wall biosynthesis